MGIGWNLSDDVQEPLYPLVLIHNLDSLYQLLLALTGQKTFWKLPEVSKSKIKERSRDR